MKIWSAKILIYWRKYKNKCIYHQNVNIWVISVQVTWCHLETWYTGVRITSKGATIHIPARMWIARTEGSKQVCQCISSQFIHLSIHGGPSQVSMVYPKKLHPYWMYVLPYTGKCGKYVLMRLSLDMYKACF